MYTNSLIPALFPYEARISYGSDRLPVDIEETDKALLVHAEVPGLKREELKIDFQDQVLTIEAKAGQEEDSSKDKEQETAGLVYRERSRASLRRRFRFKQDIDAGKIKAKLADGVLTVTLPKKKPTAPSSIKIAVD